MSMEDKENECLLAVLLAAKVTINVTSWSPDRQAVGFVNYELIP